MKPPTVHAQATPSGGMPPTTFVLKPQHADVPGAQLLFKMESEGGMALLPNDYVVKHLATEAETFITRSVLPALDLSIAEYKICSGAVMPKRL